MPRQFKVFLIRVFYLSAILVLAFNIGENLINANSSYIKNTKKENKEVFKKVNSSKLGITGVAITTNIGIRFKEMKELPVNIYKEVMYLEEIIGNEPLANKELIGKNMIIINEYKNVLKTDIKKLIDTSYDKKALLDAFIEQLEFRFKNGVDSAKILVTQRNIFTNSMESSNSKIENLKTKITTDFQNYDSKGSLENISNYMKLKNEYYYARTYTVYINLFINEYNVLNNYNKNLLDTLINNKEAIIKDAYLVIPDSGGIDSLKSFNLIYDENEIKNK